MISVMNNEQYVGDLNHLRNELQRVDVPFEDLKELLFIISKDSINSDTPTISIAATNWKMKMLNKSIAGEWNMVFSLAYSTISSSLEDFYGA